MNIRNTLITTVKSLQRNKLRSSLTSIGIIIGVSSVILMIGLGSSARVEVKDKVKNFGENGISIEVKPKGRRFTLSDLSEIKNSILEIQYISPICYKPMKDIKVRYQNHVSESPAWGVNNDYFNIQKRTVVKGRLFTNEDIISYGKVAIIGSSLEEALFGNSDSIGKQIVVNDLPLQIIGVLNDAGIAFSGNDFDLIVVMPYSTMNVRMMGKRDVFKEFLMATKEENQLESAERNLNRYLRRVHNLGTGVEPDYWLRTSKQKLKMTEDITTALTFLLAGIASISLFVGGVGIMNIMLVSVTERTREIGIRMAIGAKKKDILLQFLIESVTLTSIGGLIGIILGLIIYFAIVVSVDWIFIFSFSSILISFIFSTGVGVFFGYYPAKKASDLKPIDALKYE